MLLAAALGNEASDTLLAAQGNWNVMIVMEPSPLFFSFSALSSSNLQFFLEGLADFLPFLCVWFSLLEEAIMLSYSRAKKNL